MAAATMARHGHAQVLSYPWSFFTAAVEELAEYAKAVKNAG